MLTMDLFRASSELWLDPGPSKNFRFKTSLNFTMSGRRNISAPLGSSTERAPHCKSWMMSALESTTGLRKPNVDLDSFLLLRWVHQSKVELGPTQVGGIPPTAYDRSAPMPVGSSRGKRCTWGRLFVRRMLRGWRLRWGVPWHRVVGTRHHFCFLLFVPIFWFPFFVAFGVLRRPRIPIHRIVPLAWISLSPRLAIAASWAAERLNRTRDWWLVRSFTASPLSRVCETVPLWAFSWFWSSAQIAVL